MDVFFSPRNRKSLLIWRKANTKTLNCDSPSTAGRWMNGRNWPNGLTIFMFIRTTFAGLFKCRAYSKDFSSLMIKHLYIDSVSFSQRYLPFKQIDRQLSTTHRQSLFASLPSYKQSASLSRTPLVSKAGWFRKNIFLNKIG